MANVRAQTWWMSLIEANTQSGLGFLIAIPTNRYVLPLFGYEVNWTDSFWITIVMTLLSVVRGYFVRRAFEWHQEKMI